MFKNSKKDTIFNNRPDEGFIKIPKSGTVELNAKDRVQLVRKGNELMNQKNYIQARRVFLTVGYSAGLIRLGDYYHEEGNIYEALKMYKAAGAKSKLEAMTSKMAETLRLWINE